MPGPRPEIRTPIAPVTPLVAGLAESSCRRCGKPTKLLDGCHDCSYRVGGGIWGAPSIDTDDTY